MGQQEVRIPPQNSDAEKAVLGSMLISEEAIGDVIEILNASYFYDIAHQRIFEAMIKLFSARRNVDTITLSNQLTADGVLEAVGGVSYLTELVEFVPTAANVHHYAEIVKEKGIKRLLIKNATEIVSRSYDHQAEIDDLLDVSEQLIFNIASSHEKNQAVPLGSLLTETIEKISSLYDRKESVTGVATGFYELDKMTSGFQPSDLIIVAARPSMGKSAFAASICEYVAIEKKMPVVFFSLEMSKEQVVMRALCSQARVNASKVRAGMVSASDWPILTGAAAKLSSAPFWVDDTPAISPLELRAKARRLKAKADIGLIVVDYLQLMRGSSKSESRQQEISEISRSLKALARELKVPVIALSQLSRAVEGRTDKRPMLSDLRESGAIEQDADVVIMLMREEYYDAKPENLGMAEIIIGKQRNGPVGTIKLRFSKEFVRFDNLERTHQE